MKRFVLVFLVIPLLCGLLQSCQQSHNQKKDNTSIATAGPEMNETLGRLFMAKNKLKPGIITTPTGLQVYIAHPGVGEHPKSSDLVTVFYEGRFIDNKVFDNQYFQNKPVTVRVSSVIPGWQQALTMMQPGSIWIIYVPPQLAYGEKGIPGLIPPNSTLIYKINLVGYKK